MIYVICFYLVVDIHIYIYNKLFIFLFYLFSAILKRTIARRRNVMTAQKAPRGGLRAIAVSIMFDLFTIESIHS